MVENHELVNCLRANHECLHCYCCLSNYANKMVMHKCMPTQALKTEKKMYIPTAGKDIIYTI